MRRLESLEWWPDLIVAKDDLSLRELARRFDVTPGAIAAALRRTGVSRRPSPPGPRSAARKAAPVVGAQPAAAGARAHTSANSKTFAWSVTFAGAGTGPASVVIAPTIADALAAAKRGGDPIGVLLLGPVL